MADQTDKLVRVPERVHHRAKVAAAEQGLSLRQVVTQLLVEWVRKGAKRGIVVQGGDSE